MAYLISQTKVSNIDGQKVYTDFYSIFEDANQCNNTYNKILRKFALKNTDIYTAQKCAIIASTDPQHVDPARILWAENDDAKEIIKKHESILQTDFDTFFTTYLEHNKTEGLEYREFTTEIEREAFVNGWCQGTGTGLGIYSIFF